jgi:hypothetical protein
VLLVGPIDFEYFLAVLANPDPLRGDFFQQLPVGALNRGYESEIDFRFAVEIEREPEMDSLEVTAEKLIERFYAPLLRRETFATLPVRYLVRIKGFVDERASNGEWPFSPNLFDPKKKLSFSRGAKFAQQKVRVYCRSHGSGVCQNPSNRFSTSERSNPSQHFL